MTNRAIIRKWVLDANDGVISTAGIMQGFAGAGAQESTVLFAALALTVTGALSLGAAAFAEAAQDRSAKIEIVEEEERRIALDPAEQRDQLRRHYVEHGLSEDLAEQVAAILMQKDPLAAQLETEHGMLEAPGSALEPWAVALRATMGFASGALPVTVTVLFAGGDWQLPLTVAVVAMSLAISGLASARAGAGHPLRNIARALSIGLVIGGLSYLAGIAFDFADELLPQIEIEADDGVV